MTPEEKRRLLKEQYKKDFKERKEFLKNVEKYRQSKKLNDAIQDMTSGLLGDDSDDWISKLNQDTAVTEAKIEMAIDEAKEQQKMLEQLAQEAEMEKIEALDIVEQMKREMGLVDDSSPKEETKQETPSQKTPTAEEKAGEISTSSEDPNPPSKKTMGDF